MIFNYLKLKRSEFPLLKQKKKLTRQLSYLPSLVPDEEKEDWETLEKQNKEQEQEIIESDTKKFNESSVITFNLSSAAAFSAVKVNIIMYFLIKAIKT